MRITSKLPVDPERAEYAAVEALRGRLFKLCACECLCYANSTLHQRAQLTSCVWILSVLNTIIARCSGAVGAEGQSVCAFVLAVCVLAVCRISVHVTYDVDLLATRAFREPLLHTASLTMGVKRLPLSKCAARCSREACA